MTPQCLIPEWPAPPNIRALQTTRQGGVSAAPYDKLNLGTHVGDDPLAVATNRQRLQALVPSEPVWLEQVHGTAVVRAENAGCQPVADACVTDRTGAVCVVMTADCLPVLLCDRQGQVVGAAHAGWRGLADGVIEAAVAAMGVIPADLMAWLGPAIGPHAFEVGPEVREIFLRHAAEASAAFIPRGEKFLANLDLLATQRLQTLGITQIFGGGLCTYRDAGRFFSYRRDGRTGRMASMIWIEAQGS